jgi:hypothetical protein
MGTVYKAWDQQLPRPVAVKVPRVDLWPENRTLALQRFLREARLSAGIRHPNVCPVYDVGEHAGFPYVVMALIEGPSLADLAKRDRLEVARVVRLARQVAAALAVIHDHGIIHRDLKPGNILLDSAGEPLVTDFGLARPVVDDEPLTRSGIAVGTPTYMAPEQALGDASSIGAWTDIYSLGTILYRLLTGRLPSEGTVRGRDSKACPEAPSSQRLELDPALEMIVLKAIARQPEKRYRTARELVEALDGWSQRETTVSELREASPVTEAAPRTETVVQAALPGGDAVTVAVQHPAVPAGGLNVTIRDQPRTTRKRRRRLVVSVTITFAAIICVTVLARTGGWSLKERLKSESANQQALRAEVLSSACKEIAGSNILQGQLVTLSRLIDPPPLAPDTSVAASFSPDGKLIGIGASNQTCQLWDVATGKPVAAPLSHRGPVTAVAFSSDGHTLATGSTDKTARLWEAATGKPVGQPLVHRDRVVAVAFGPDGARLASAADNGEVMIWDARTGTEERSLKGMAHRVHSVAFSPDGRLLASASAEGIVKVWNVTTAELTLALSADAKGVTTLAFSPDGQTLAAGSPEGTVLLWDTATSEKRAVLVGPGSAITHIAFSPDGRRLATTAADRTVRVWEIGRYATVLSFQEAKSPILSLTFRPDDRGLIVQCSDGTVMGSAGNFGD